MLTLELTDRAIYQEVDKKSMNGFIDVSTKLLPAQSPSEVINSNTCPKDIIEEVNQLAAPNQLSVYEF